MIYSEFLAFGDSITYGSRDDNNMSYPAYLSQMIKEKYNQRLFFDNAGIPGETSTEAVKRAYSLIKNSKCYEVLFFEGTNDAKDSVQTNLEVYKFNLEYIVDTCKAFNKKLYLATIPDLNGFGAPDYSVRSQERIYCYNKIVIHVSEKYKLPLLDLRFFSSDLYSDGVHLNSKGYKKIAEILLIKIEKERLFTNI